MDESRARIRTIGLVAVQIAIAVVVARQIMSAGHDYEMTSGFGRYFTIAGSGGTPYHDFGVEYPPLAVALFKALPSTFNAFVRSMILVNIAAQIGIAVMVFSGWGRRALWSYLALTAPLMPILYARFDLVGIAFAVLGAYLLVRKLPVAAGLSWIVGAFVKLWPGVLVPSLAARREWRAFVASAVVGGAGLVAWVAWGGTGAPGQVTGYRGAKGWEFESVPGAVFRLVTRHPLRLESGAWRLGAPPAAAGFVLTLAMVAAVVATWWYVAHHDVRAGTAEVVVVSVVLVTGTLLSPQFIGWVLPFVAIAAAAGGERIERWAAAVVVLTFLEWALFDVDHAGKASTELAALGRNAALVGLLVVAVADLRRSPARSETAGRTAAPVAT